MNKFVILDPSRCGEGKEKVGVVWDSGNTHTSLAYAADWNRELIVTGSFYDQKVAFWKKFPSLKGVLKEEDPCLGNYQKG